MQYTSGDYVVYNGADVCRVGETVVMDFTGEKKEYITLFPTQVQTKIYIPTEKCESLFRPLISKEKIMYIIEKMANIEEQTNDSADIDYKQAAKNGDYDSIIAVMHDIYIENRNREQNNKPYIKADKMVFDAAKKLIDSEFAIVLGIDSDNVENFIRKNLKKSKA